MPTRDCHQASTFDVAERHDSAAVFQRQDAAVVDVSGRCRSCRSSASKLGQPFEARGQEQSAAGRRARHDPLARLAHSKWPRRRAVYDAKADSVRGSRALHFTPPDTGTFFFHTHCNSVEHFGRGLVGALIVEGDEIAPSDADIVLMMKDWRYRADGAFLPFTTDEGAAKAGTSGTVRSINGVTKPVIDVPASAQRARAAATMSTRCEFQKSASRARTAAIIAVDGNPCGPMPLSIVADGTGHRVSISCCARRRLAAWCGVMDYFSPNRSLLAELSRKASRCAATSSWQRRCGNAVCASAISPRPSACRWHFRRRPPAKRLAALRDLPAIEIGSLCLTTRTFWAINKQAWPSADHKNLGPPLAKLQSRAELHIRTAEPDAARPSDPYSRPHVRGVQTRACASCRRFAPIPCCCFRRSVSRWHWSPASRASGCSIAISSSIRRPA